MTTFIERRAAPAPQKVATLADLMHEGFHMLTMLRAGQEPPPVDDFIARIREFLAGFERDARALRASADDIEAAKYAFCAALDEIVLASHSALRPTWERRPLQLLLFGDQLAGEHFFDKLEQLRIQGAARLPALQVFHMCLLLGFQGRYKLDDPERLAYLSARLGDEIAHLRGKSKGFAPRAARPDQIAHKLHGNAPAWIAATVFGLAAAATFGLLRYTLDSATASTLAPYRQIVGLPPQPASLTITLP